MQIYRCRHIALGNIHAKKIEIHPCFLKYIAKMILYIFNGNDLENDREVGQIDWCLRIPPENIHVKNN